MRDPEEALEKKPAAATPESREQKVVVRMYGALMAAMLMMFVPMLSASLVAVVLIACVLAAAGFVGRRAAENSLTANHMIFIIRTIWISCLFSSITLTAGALYLWPNVDVTAIEPCAKPISDYVFASGANLSPHQVMALLFPCREPLIEANCMPLVIASAVAIVPMVVYLALRMARGIGRASKGYRIANPKAWF